MSDKDTLVELAAGTDLGRRVARLERRTGIGAVKVHWATTADGFFHAQPRGPCYICPPIQYRRVSITASGTLALVTDTRTAAQVPAAETAEREDVLQAAKELGITGRIWKRPAPPDSIPQPQEDA
jgi:hypothetical protein